MHTKNFHDYEFVCRCGTCEHSIPHNGLISERLMIALQHARNILGAPIVITSGRRCKKRNARVGGVPNSYHTQGLAADIVADDMIKLLHAVCAVKTFTYIEPHDSYIHVDIGKKRTSRVNDKRTVKFAA